MNEDVKALQGQVAALKIIVTMLLDALRNSVGAEEAVAAIETEARQTVREAMAENESRGLEMTTEMHFFAETIERICRPPDLDEPSKDIRR